MKKEHIFLIIILLCTFLIRIYNANELSGVVDNTSCTKPGEWHCNEPEKYNWLMKNTVDITYKAGLKPGNPYFRLYEYKSK